jgi:hypothetical protein
MMPSGQPGIATATGNGMVTVMLHAPKPTICNELVTESIKLIGTSAGTSQQIVSVWQAFSYFVPTQ